MLNITKILPVVALGICWMLNANHAQSFDDCPQRLADCNARKGKANTGEDWWACEVYKDETVAGKIGKAYFACCMGQEPQLPGSLIVNNNCTPANCDLANKHCPGLQYK